MLRRSWLLLAAVVGFIPAARADVKVHPIFSDHMVLQRDTEIVVWGTADDGERVEVAVGGLEPFIPTPVAATVTDGKWSAKLPPLKAGTGLTLKVKGKNTVEFKNVAVGDVWLCSGQSNMEWKLNQLNLEDKAKGTTATQGADAAKKAENRNIRLFTVPNRPFLEPQSTVEVVRPKNREGKFEEGKEEGVWLECDEKSVFNFSAVGYFFGRHIQATQNVPVGLIAADWGGTNCETWTSKEALDAVPELRYMHEGREKKVKEFDPAKAEADLTKAMEKYDADLAKWKGAADTARAEGKQPPQQPRRPQLGRPFDQNSPSCLFNGMIHPITRFKIKGALWYQGESNGGPQNDYARPKEYYTLFPTMIQDWRKRWGYDFPFFVVQLAPYSAGNSDDMNYAIVRDAQFQASKKLKYVGYATLSDIGNETDIHPQAKEPVGQRLALAARAIAYGEQIEWSGPVYKGMKMDGGKVVLSFDHVGKGLECKGDKLEGFTVCGEDKKFVPAEAKIVGDTVEVTAKEVSKPVAVRYGWVNFAKPDLNFFNKDGLPAVPFRTDDFPLTTLKK
jgi:sialate O-acetylesterase